MKKQILDEHLCPLSNISVLLLHNSVHSSSISCHNIKLKKTNWGVSNVASACQHEKKLGESDSNIY